jgi:Flp pilus assembly protein TadG
MDRTRNDRGVVAIEFVLVFPFLLLILFAVVVMGGYMSAKTRTVGAARDGARAAALSQAYTPPAGITVTLTSAPCPPRTDPTFNTRDVTVEATSTFTAVSIIGMPAQTITEPGRMRCGG